MASLGGIGAALVDGRASAGPAVHAADSVHAIIAAVIGRLASRRGAAADLTRRTLPDAITATGAPGSHGRDPIAILERLRAGSRVTSSFLTVCTWGAIC